MKSFQISGCIFAACLLSPCFIAPSSSFTIVTRQSRCLHSYHHYGLGRSIKLPFDGHKLGSINWDGDDLRWSERLRRRIESRLEKGTETPLRDALIASNIAMYIYQAINTLCYLKVTYPSYWPSWSMISDAILDSGSTIGPLTRAFMFSAHLGKRQPHRYLTSGFLHGGLLHLIGNLYALHEMPNWLETGLGWPLFVTTYLVGIVAGNWAHARSAPMDEFLVGIGASGGIVALAGLAFVSLAKMKNQPATLQILKNVAALLVLGAVIPSVSNAAHIGGFISGCFMGLAFSPGYRKSYSLRRQNAYNVDTAPKDFRRAMGFGIVPNDRAPIPLAVFWAAVVFYVSTDYRFRNTPVLVWRGLIRPGSL
ncbi:hypothetical protein MHU86_4644 [Fragilaria crotonensis]|nr:hypothetical protein MHU86_4644 [Fragilaria crotonensis]